MKFSFMVRTADYKQELEIQTSNRLGATPSELDRYTILMILGNVYTQPLSVTVEPCVSNEEVSFVTIETSCDSYLQAAARYCLAREFVPPAIQ